MSRCEGCERRVFNDNPHYCTKKKDWVGGFPLSMLVDCAFGPAAEDLDCQASISAYNRGRAAQRGPRAGQREAHKNFQPGGPGYVAAENSFVRMAQVQAAGDGCAE